jgi:acyl-coenzyme A synthetase/AMP-(fatty) acid ligase
MSIIDLYVTWSGGATVVAAGRSDMYNPIAYVVGRGLTHWVAVPSSIDFARRMTPAPPPDSSLRVSFFAGEELKSAQLSAWWEAFPKTRVLNGYGPTETTITCLVHEVDRADLAPAARVPIGRANPGVECIILPDEDGSAGRGELCVRGVQRFDGYVDPADNAGKFVDERGRVCSPASPAPPELYYRTGDLVTAEDDAFTYRGRVDNMVKVRGFRVELEELEVVARAAPGVRETGAVVAPSAIGDTLNLFVVVDAGYDEGAARAWLMEALPRYMVPKEILAVERLPLNPNGKLDRRVLGQWAADRSLIRARP